MYSGRRLFGNNGHKDYCVLDLWDKSVLILSHGSLMGVVGIEWRTGYIMLPWEVGHRCQGVSVSEVF